MIAAQELYNRDLVYHKSKKVWYRREKAVSNYAFVAMKEEFSLSSWSFIPCTERVKSLEVMTLAELNEAIKLLL